MLTRAMGFACSAVVLLIPLCGAQIEVVKDGVGKMVIHHDSDAPPSVQMGATELQAYIQKATGAELPIVTTAREPMISLGRNAASQAAELTVADIPVEGFRILTKGQNIYILGPDTAEGERTAHGGISTGTRNGVYAFLEDYLGVRWLVPGPHGDYVPKAESVSIPQVDRQDAPFFLNRRVPYTQQSRPEVIRWWARQRLGWSLSLSHGHNWRRPIPSSQFDEHPDWFPEFGGKRVPPTGRYKLCTTNPGLIREFANKAIAHFDARPESTCFSLSPSDSAGYCECSECTKLYETDPNGKRSVTPAILTFYNAVARLVAEKHPEKLLAGYVYAGYVFPPHTPIKLEPNVFLVWAPSFDYGFTLHRPELQRQWEDLLGQWGKVTENISYYDLPVHISTEAGALNPPGLKILKFMYPRLQKAQIKGVYVYGIGAWGRSGALNYLLSKLAWNPSADIEALFDEFCAKAYGQGGPEINRMFRLLDAEVERHFLAFPDARYTLTNDMMKDIYVPNWDAVETLVRAAEAKVQDPDAKARLAMIGMNLTVMHWSLRQYKMFPDPEASTFYMPDAEFFEFMRENRGSLALQPTKSRQKGAGSVQKLSIAPVSDVPNAEPVSLCRLRGNQHIVVYPTGAGATEVRFSGITSRGKLVTYTVLGSDGEEITSGMMSAGMPVPLDAEGSAYFHVVISAGSASFSVQVVGGSWAVMQPRADLESQGLHFLGNTTPAYFAVPAGIDSFHLSLTATPPGETAAATLYAPDGREVAQYDCAVMPVDRKKIAVGENDEGWWKIVIRDADTGVLDDVWLSLGNELPGCFSLDPTQALSVTPVKKK